MVKPPTSKESSFVEDAVLAITSGTSDNYVPAPNESQVMSDLLIGIKRFKNSVRWKAFFLAEDTNNKNKINRNEHNSMNLDETETDTS